MVLVGKRNIFASGKFPALTDLSVSYRIPTSLLFPRTFIYVEKNPSENLPSEVTPSHILSRLFYICRREHVLFYGEPTRSSVILIYKYNQFSFRLTLKLKFT